MTVLVGDAVVELGGRPVLRGIDLEVHRGEVVAVLGPSGSGKTTLLSAIAGFTPLQSGSIIIDGRAVSGPNVHVPPERRSIGFVFQSYALWPHLTVLETVAFALRAQGAGRAAAEAKAVGIIEALGIGELSGRRPAELSGGQQQRVGLARALARDAKLFLLDEPTAHLDGWTRSAAESLIASQREATGAAAIYATHEPGEALGVADRLALLRDGRVVQIGPPDEVYERPVDAWAAHLTGSASIVDAVQAQGMLHIGDAVVAVEGARDGPASLLIRPEWARLGGPAQGVVTAVRFRGPHTDVTIESAVGAVDVRVAGVPVPRRGERIGWRPLRVWPV